MADIYGKSALTISAIEAAGDTEGFLLRPILYPAQVHWTELITGISGRVSFRLPDTGWQRLLSSRSPLMKRGWTLQERLLSPRILHFGKQTYWECHQSRRSEDGQFDQESTGFEQHRHLCIELALKFIYNDDGRVEMGDFEMEHACTWYRIRCDDHPPESLGKVLYGKIDVQGPIAPCTVKSHDNTNEYILGVDENGSADERDQIVHVGEIILLETDDRPKKHTWKCILDKQHRFENQDEVSNEWWLLQMVTSIETRKDQSSLMGVRHWAIVIEPQHKVETYDNYKRVGVAFLDVDASVTFEKQNIRKGESGVLNRIWLGHSDNQWCEKRIRLI